jgi:hypothetical protein
MGTYNLFFKIFKKLNFLINSLLRRNLNKLNFLFEKEKLSTFISFKKAFVSLSLLLVFTIAYLCIPYFYDNNKLINKIKTQFSKNLNIKLNLSDNFKYNLFPKPNFIFKDVSFLNQNENVGDMKIYISMKNLLHLNKIEVEEIIFEKMNFDIDKKNYSFFIKLLNNNFSKFDLKINNSNIFYKNFENEVLFINKIKQLKYFYDAKNLENILSVDGAIFNIPYKAEIKDNINEKMISSIINFDFINLKIENNLSYNNFEKNGLIKFFYNKDKSEGVYDFSKNFFKFNFLDKSLDQNFQYSGLINLKPFFSQLSGEINKIYLNKLLNPNSILIQFLKTEILNSKNLNITTSIKAKQIASFRDLINLVLKIKISEGLIDINETKFSWQDVVDFKLSDSLLFINKGNLVLDSLVSIDIRDYNEFYMFFQTPRNLRNDIKKIEFNINYNFDQLTFKLNNIKVNDSINEAINDALSEIILKDSNHQNKIYFKKLVNQAIKLYAG